MAFLDGGVYDRDDRTLFLGGAQVHDVVLAGPAAVDEVVVFVANGSEPSRVRAKVGWASRVRPLNPGDWAALRFQPRWWWPARPALYRVRVEFLPEGRTALVQIRAGAREIGEAYAGWGRWDAAVPYLERALAAHPGDGEVLLLLGTAYHRLGRGPDARRMATRLEAEAPGYVAILRQLGQGAEPPERWTPAFAQLTGLDAALLVPALTREVRIDAVLARGRLGGDPGTPGMTAAVFERGTDRPGSDPQWAAGAPASPVSRPGRLPRTVHAPRAGRAPRARRARCSASSPSAGSWRRGRSSRTTLGDGRSRVDVPVPFVLDGPPTPVAVQVEATGRGSFAVDRVQIEPDLPATFRERWRALQALGG